MATNRRPYKFIIDGDTARPIHVLGVSLKDILNSHWPEEIFPFLLDWEKPRIHKALCYTTRTESGEGVGHIFLVAQKEAPGILFDNHPATLEPQHEAIVYGLDARDTFMCYSIDSWITDISAIPGCEQGFDPMGDLSGCDQAHLVGITHGLLDELTFRIGRYPTPEGLSPERWSLHDYYAAIGAPRPEYTHDTSRLIARGQNILGQLTAFPGAEREFSSGRLPELGKLMDRLTGLYFALGQLDGHENDWATAESIENSAAAWAAYYTGVYFAKDRILKERKE